MTKAAPVEGAFLNGSFESPTMPSPPDLQRFFTGDNISGWSVVGNDVLLLNSNYAEPGNGITTFNSQHGFWNVDLTGLGNTGIENGVRQSIATTPGAQYLLTFHVGRASGNSFYSTNSTLDLSIDGGARISFTNANETPNFVNWQEFSTPFTATNSSTLITFFNGTSGTDNFFVGLDNVQILQIQSVPEPSSLALFVMGAAGMTLVVARRRKRQTHS